MSVLGAIVAAMDIKIEVVFVPVSDIDRAKEFYELLGFHPDHDQRPTDDIRFVQMTPPGSACSIAFGSGLGISAEPGSMHNVMAVIDDADKMRAELLEKGVEVSEVDEQAWGRFLSVTDPDGNGWILQQLPDYSASSAG
jgi:catechol 2,3-dioxygenase-like lactoylglutathione lyase family enzyme